MDLGGEDPLSQKAEGGGLCHRHRPIRQGDTLQDYGCDFGLKRGG